MKLIMLEDELCRNSNANTNIANNLAEEFRRCGHEVVWICQSIDKYREKIEISNYLGMKQYILSTIPFQKLSRFQKQKKWAELGKINRIKEAVFHPVYTFYMFDLGKFEYCFSSRQTAKVIDKIIKREKADAIIVFASPFYSAITMTHLKTKAKKVLYQLDPYSFNDTIKGSVKWKKYREKKFIEKADIVYVTKIMYESYKNILYRKSRRKVDWLEFPNIKEIDNKEWKKKADFNSEKIHCIFMGNFYKSIRNPEFTLELFNRMEEDNIILHIFGGGDAEDVLEEYKKKMDKRLILHGYVDNEEAKRILAEADILLNVNNSVENQLASKLFDYISIGKPIINICKLDNCPSLPYVKKYPLSLTIFEKNGISEKVVKELLCFCVESRGKSCQYSEIKKIYRKNTPEYVAKKITKKICRER